jgi:murein DD-endopeptidase MepM/ murein hydrolase activator NlpD
VPGCNYSGIFIFGHIFFSNYAFSLNCIKIQAMKKSEKVIQILKDNRDFIAKIMDVDFSDKNVYVFDFTENNSELYSLDLDDTNAFTEYVFNTLKKEKKGVGVGGYGEDRLIYKRSKHFDGEGEPRSIHLGMDIWINENTPVFAPLPGIIHSFKNNSTFGDYGPTIIIEHLIEKVTFYTLYGHLSLDSITGLEKGKLVRRGDEIARVGNQLVNGNWPPHLHFQIITDMLGNEGDFPGVAPPSAKEYFMDLCIDPNLILKIKVLPRI